VEKYGFVWSASSSQPTLENSDGKTDLGNLTELKKFQSRLKGLQAQTTYYIRAYATNAGGTSFGVVKSFTTKMPQPPSAVSTFLPTELTQATAKIGGSINNYPIGVSNAIAYGFCWATSPNPDLSNDKSILGSANTVKEFEDTISALSSATTYYVRAYITTSAGTVYGNEISFKTLAK
jgi:hypothetical protein